MTVLRLPCLPLQKEVCLFTRNKRTETDKENRLLYIMMAYMPLQEWFYSSSKNPCETLLYFNQSQWEPTCHYSQPSPQFAYRKLFSGFQEQAHRIYSEQQHYDTTERMQVKTHPKDSFVLRSLVNFQFQALVENYPDSDPTCHFSLRLCHSVCRPPHLPPPLAPQLPRVQIASQ